MAVKVTTIFKKYASYHGNIIGKNGRKFVKYKVPKGYSLQASIYSVILCFIHSLYTLISQEINAFVHLLIPIARKPNANNW